MTLDSAIINLKGVFEYGQAYVALSRAKDVNNLFLKNVTKSAFKAHPKALEFYRQFERRQETIPENNESNKVDDDEVTL